MRPSLLLTRPASAAARFLADLGGLAPAEISPLITIVPLAPVWAGDPVESLILTSEHGATMAAGMGFPAGLAAYCIGERTAEAAKAAGFRPIVAGGDADRLVSLILSQPPGGPMLHLHGEHTRGQIATRLRAAGRACAEQVVYRQVEQPLTAAARALLSGPAPVIAPLFSPRTASLLAAQAPFAAPVHVVAMSDAIRSAAMALGPASVDVAAHPDNTAMIAATISRLRALIADPSA